MNERAKIIGNFSLNWTQRVKKKEANPLEDGELDIFHRALERWTLAKGRKFWLPRKREKYAKHRQTINIWTRIPGTCGVETSERERTKSI